MNVTCVDQHLEWKKILQETVDSLYEGTFGNCSKLVEDLNVITNYLNADLTDSLTWCDDMKSSLEQADVVFMVKVLSHIPDEKKLITIQVRSKFN